MNRIFLRDELPRKREGEGRLFGQPFPFLLFSIAPKSANMMLLRGSSSSRRRGSRGGAGRRRALGVLLVLLGLIAAAHRTEHAQAQNHRKSSKLLHGNTFSQPNGVIGYSRQETLLPAVS
jgi:hypothetical protein